MQKSFGRAKLLHRGPIRAAFNRQIVLIRDREQAKQEAENFRNDEDGAVTVDWVVLTAAIVALGLAVGTAVSNGATDLAGDVGTELTDM